MDREGLTTYFTSIKLSKAAIARSLAALDAFEGWLKTERNRSIDEELCLEDLKAFIQASKKGQKNLLMGLANVFGFQGKDDLRAAAVQMRRSMLDEEVKPMPLRDFIGVHETLLTHLQEKGIQDTWQLLDACRTPESRKALAAELGVLYKSLLDLVKMADLSRLFAVKAVRTRLYLDSCFDTLDKLAAQDPMELHRALVRFVEQTHFDGVPTTPKEAEGTVKAARELERWVQFEDGE